MADMQSQKNDEEPSSTIVVETDEIGSAPVPSVRMKLKKPKKKKKKLTGCCIYEKPKVFGESSSESDDDECEHCKGHVEQKHRSANSKFPSDNNHINPLNSDSK
ncbi:hypothetical protein CEXT_673851 [Caerostris extrusa]|uniref:Uncharacterized protein n=1 Tax=Caerostris extrusa TaxID=172846 RepID=A0AAV4X2Z5_CAEEX|nr:hypothetical protein CEXT_673851 [Caerostris extrusa]